jgi:hypothetical protein
LGQQLVRRLVPPRVLLWVPPPDLLLAPRLGRQVVQLRALVPVLRLDRLLDHQQDLLQAPPQVPQVAHRLDPLMVLAQDHLLVLLAERSDQLKDLT